MIKPAEKPTSEQIRALGVEQSYAWRLAHGKAQPSLGLALKIERATGYPVNAWPVTVAAGE
jgi:transcriptional regulator with XRE-family HTH domain